MFDFFEDFFDFSDDTGDTETHGESSNPIAEVARTFFDSWQDSTNDFFTQLQAATQGAGEPAQDFVSAWQQATESFADQYASLWGWHTDDSPV